MLSEVKLLLVAWCCGAQEPPAHHQEPRVARALEAPWDPAQANSWAQSSSKAAKAWDREGTEDSSWAEESGAGETGNTWDGGQGVRRDREVATARQVGRPSSKNVLITFLHSNQS